MALMRHDGSALVRAVVSSSILVIAACGATPASAPDSPRSTSPTDAAAAPPADGSADSFGASPPLAMVDSSDPAAGVLELLESPGEARTVAISGAIDNSVGTDRLAVSINSTTLYLIPYRAREPLPADTASTAEAVLLGADGTELHRMPFSVARPRASFEDDVLQFLPWSSDLEPQSYDFGIFVPIWLDVDRIDIEVDGQAVHTLFRSPSGPKLDVLVDGSVVSWDATDADGDLVTVTVLGLQGDQLIPLRGDTLTVSGLPPDPAYNINAIDITTLGMAASDDASVIVVASDGFNVVVTQVDGLSIEK